MTAKKLVQEFYKSDALIDPAIMKTFLHPEVVLDWHSSTGFLQMDLQQILAFTTNIAQSYIRTKARITHLLQDGDTVTVRFAHSVKTIENPREEMPLANFIVIWEVKDGKLYRGYQMSQPA